METNYKHIFGPVFSWRLGMSLGIDPLSQESKLCNFHCVYCQLGETEHFSAERKVFVPTEDIIKEIRTLPNVEIDYITFSGRGEPTLALNLGEMIRSIRSERKEKIVVITNASLIYQEDVQRDLLSTDFVLAKLDGHNQKMLEKVNRSMTGIRFDDIVQGIMNFRDSYEGKLALQIMLTEDNKNYAPQLAALAKEIQPDEIQLNTPLRACAVNPLKKKEMDELKIFFSGVPVISVYDVSLREVDPFSKEETFRRHGSSQVP